MVCRGNCVKHRKQKASKPIMDSTNRNMSDIERSIADTGQTTTRGKCNNRKRKIAKQQGIRKNKRRQHGGNKTADWRAPTSLDSGTPASGMRHKVAQRATNNVHNTNESNQQGKRISKGRKQSGKNQQNPGQKTSTNKRKADSGTHKGLSHAYHANTPCSKRTKLFKNEVERSGKAASKKDIVINGCRTTLRIDERDNKRFLTYLKHEKEKVGKHKVFFSGKSNIENDAHVNAQSEGGMTVSIIDNNNIKVVDEKHGVSCFNKSSGQIVFILLPRKEVLKMKGCEEYLEALEQVESCHAQGHGKRGAERETVFEGNKKVNYQNLGVAANRGGRGLIYKFPKHLQGTKHQKAVNSWTRGILTLVENYIPKQVLRSIRKVCDRVGLDTLWMNGGKAKNRSSNCPKMNYCPTLAVSRNVALSLHTDEDASFSITAVYKKEDIVKTVNRAQFSKDSDILKYFTFECGVSVGMRSGDLLVFNPQEAHCISTNTDACGEGGVITTSHYLKANVVGLNNNEINFPEFS